MAYQNPDGSFRSEWGGPPVTTVVPLTGDTVPISSSTRVLYIAPAAGIAALTIKLPRSPENGQYIDIGFSQAVTALTVQDGNGVAVAGAPAGGAAGSSVLFRYFSLGLGLPSLWVKWR